jgi:pimeloyl-ACP methyl ester carboxylesterase
MGSNFVRSNGIDLHYLDHPGQEPTVVLLPGLTGNAYIFDGLIQAGLSPRFRVLALDLRGRGQSDAPPAGFDPTAPAANYTMADHAADMVGVIDALGVDHPVLAGHSFGGMLALHLAAHFPERFQRVVVLDWAIALMVPATRELLKPTLARLGQVAPSWEVFLAAMKRLPFLTTGGIRRLRASTGPTFVRILMAPFRRAPDRRSSRRRSRGRCA